MKVQPIELCGERVQLQPLAKSHLEGIVRAMAFPEIWPYMPMKMATHADAERFVDDALKAASEGTEVPFVVVDRPSGEVVGSTRFLDIQPQNRSLEIGWTWYTPKVWRTRVNTECKYLLFKHCFETLETIRVQLKCDGRNVRSQDAIERLGATREGVLRKHRVTYTGFVRDSVYYSVIEEEWPSVKTRLESFLARSR